MTVFGWDASDFDWSRGPMNLAAARADGISFFTHKATEGTSVRHIHYGAALTRARDAGIPVLGAYHVVRSLGALSTQVAWFLRYLDEATPWWRAHPNFFLQVDLERWSYDQVAPLTGTALADQLAAATGKTVVIYASKGQYGASLGGSRPLWNANYPTGRAGGYAALYAAAGGDTGPGWQSYSNRTPVIWQYADSAVIGGEPGCDANAFRGTLGQLLTLTSGDDVSAHTDAVVAAWAVGIKTAADGTTVAPVDWRIRDEAWQAQVTAALAADATRDAAVLAAIQGLASAGGVDSAPIVAAVNAVRDEARTQFSALHDQLATETTARQAAEARVAQLEHDLAAAYSAASGTVTS